VLFGPKEIGLLCSPFFLSLPVLAQIHFFSTGWLAGCHRRCGISSRPDRRRSFRTPAATAPPAQPRAPSKKKKRLSRELGRRLWNPREPARSRNRARRARHWERTNDCEGPGTLPSPSISHRLAFVRPYKSAQLFVPPVNRDKRTSIHPAIHRVLAATDTFDSPQLEQRQSDQQWRQRTCTWRGARRRRPSLSRPRSTSCSPS
jgi:hypothetical protein